MATVDATIGWLEKLPDDIRERGIQITKDSIVRNGNVDNGDMLKSVQGSASGDTVHIRVWKSYAGYVNDGHGPAVPRVRKTWKKKDVNMLKFKVSPKWSADNGGPIYAYYASGYEGSHFFDQAYVELLAYIHTL